MSDQQVAGLFDQCNFGLVFNRKFQNFAVPSEILLPCFCGKCFDPLPCTATEFCLVPRAWGEARNAQVNAPHILGRSQSGHAGKSAPGSFESARVTIYDPDIVYALAF